MVDRRSMSFGRKAVSATRSLRCDQPLILEVADLRHRDVGELVAEFLADDADRSQSRLGVAAFLSPRVTVLIAEEGQPYLPICTSSSSVSSVDSMRFRLT